MKMKKESETLNIFLRNIVEIKGRSYLVGGRDHLDYVVVKDACMSARTLVLLKRDDCVINLIDLYVKSLNTKTMTPISSFRDVGPATNTLRSAISIRCGEMCVAPRQRDTFRPFSENEFDEHLWIMLSASYLPQQQISKYSPVFAKMLEWYTPHITWGWNMLLDPRTDTHSFMTNLLLYEVQIRLANILQPIIPTPFLKESLLSLKSDEYGGVFCEGVEKRRTIRLADNLFALLWSFGNTHGLIPKKSKDASAFFATLEKSPLGKGLASTTSNEDQHDCLCFFNRFPPSTNTGIPGFAAFGDITPSSTYQRLLGISGYNSSMYHTWLMALFEEVRSRVEHIKDTAQSSKAPKLDREMDRNVFEVMRHTTELDPVETCMFRGDTGHTLGAAFLLRRSMFELSNTTWL